MQEIADILGIPPDSTDAVPAGGVDESQAALDAGELAALAAQAQASLDAITALQAKSRGFATEIGQLSAAMAALKAQSAGLHHKLHARDAALAQLDPLLAQLVPDSADIDAVFDGEIGPRWYAALDRLRHPLQLPPGLTQTAAGDDAKTVASAHKLRRVVVARALERAKSQFVARLRALRRPGTNAQLVQLELVAAAPALQLLAAQTPRLAAALGRAYRNTMRWYYTLLFGKYGRWLGRQPLAAQDHPRLLGAALPKASAPFFGLGAADARSLDAFSVGARPTVLTPDADGPEAAAAADPLLAPAADEPGAVALPMTAVPPPALPQYPLEILVRSLLATLADSFEMEARVAPLIAGQPAPFTEVFEPTLAFYASVLQGWIAQCAGDLFGLLLAVRLAEESSLRQWVPEWLDAAVAARCWPLIRAVCEEQARSIEAAALRASTPAGAPPRGPHLLTQLVSSYLSGVLQLCPGQPEQGLRPALQGIIEAYELFISKLAAGDETVLYDNYFVMAALLGDIPGALAQEIAQHFQLLVDAHAKQSK